MTTFTFNTNVSSFSVDWDNPAVWVGGMVANGSGADVVFPAIPASGAQGSYDVSVLPGETYAIHSLTSAAQYFLTVDGTLSVSGDISGGAEFDMQGGSLSFGTLENDSYIQGGGEITGGTLTNADQIIGSALTLNLQALDNTGTLMAASGTLTVKVAAGGFKNFSGTTLTGGTYAAGYSGNKAANSNVLYLDIGNVVTVDAADITLDGGGEIESYDASTQQYVPLQSTLTDIASGGELTLDDGVTAAWGPLTVDGVLDLAAGAAFSSSNLVIDAKGTVTGAGQVGGAIVNNGALLAGQDDTLDITGTVSGSGAVEIAGGSYRTIILETTGYYEDLDGGVLEISAPVSQSVRFLGAVGTLIVDDPATLSGAIATDGKGDAIQVDGYSLSSVLGYSYSGDAASGTLTVATTSGAFQLNFVGNYSKADFSLSPGPSNGSSPSLIVTNAGAPEITFTSRPGNQLTEQISGTIDAAHAGETISIYDGATRIGTAASAANGDWSGTFTLTHALGVHSVTAEATSAEGDTGVSDPNLYTISAPSVAITSAGGLVNSTSQNISGTVAAPDETVSIYDGSTLIGTTTSASDDDWSVTLTLPSNQGPQTVTAQTTDADGFTGTSNPVTYVLDTVAPTLTITSHEGAEDSRLQTVTGTIDVADAGLAIAIWDGATLLGETTADAEGDWAINVVLPLTGPQTLTAEARDAAGNLGQSNGVVYSFDLAANHADLHAAINEPYSAYEYDYSAGGDLIGTRVYYTLVAHAAYTGTEYDYNGAGDVTRALFVGVSGADYSSYQYDYVGGVFAGAAYEVTSPPAGATYASYELDFNSAGQFVGDKFFSPDVSGQLYTGEEQDFDASGRLSRVLLTGFSGAPYTSLELDYADGVYDGYKAFYPAGAHQGFATEEVDVSAGGELEKVVYSGLTGTPYSSLEQDYETGDLNRFVYDFTDVTGAAAYAYQVAETAQGSLLNVTYDNIDGSHTIVGAAGAQTFTSLGEDTFTGGGGGETFVFTPVYGHDAITDFYPHTSGGGHDVASFSTSEFATVQDILNATVDTSAGAEITAADGDSVLLTNVSKATLTANPTDLAVHP